MPRPRRLRRYARCRTCTRTLWGWSIEQSRLSRSFCHLAVLCGPATARCWLRPLCSELSALAVSSRIVCPTAPSAPSATSPAHMSTEGAPPQSSVLTLPLYFSSPGASSASASLSAFCPRICGGGSASSDARGRPRSSPIASSREVERDASERSIALKRRRISATNEGSRRRRSAAAGIRPGSGTPRSRRRRASRPQLLLCRRLRRPYRTRRRRTRRRRRRPRRRRGDRGRDATSSSSPGGRSPLRARALSR